MRTAALQRGILVIAVRAVAKEKRDCPNASGSSVTGCHIWTANTHTHIPPRPQAPGWLLSCFASGRVQTMWLQS